MSAFNQVFQRNRKAITSQQQQLLQNATVVVAGCGGLGGYVIEELARIGIGSLFLADPDHFSISNINRQVNALSTTLHRNKAEVAAERVRAMHSYTEVKAYTTDFRAIPLSVFEQVDLVVDCLDSIQARRDLASLCNRLHLPLVHGAVSGWTGQVGVQMPGYDLFALLYPQQVVSVEKKQPLSVLSFTVATVASIQAAEAVKLVLGLVSPLRNQHLVLDLKEGEWVML
ncbi:MAG: molybdopterin biosynthesis protein MoeB [Desulfobulbus propionicus]|nr:MAG: molybdopterin biosynthesis protein MoeB [Desulfobulbus propionicus]